MNKTYKYTLTAHEKKEISFETGVARLAIANGDGVDGSTTVIMSEITKQHSGEIVSFIDGADAPFADFIVNIEAVQSGSGDPSPENERPISGFNSAVISRYGKNFVNAIPRTVTTVSGITSEVREDNTIVASGRTLTQNGDIEFYVTPFTIPVGTSTFSLQGLFEHNGGVAVFLYTNDYGKPYYIPSSVNFFTITTTQELNVTKILVRMPTNVTVNINAKIQIELGATATPYEPYKGNTYNIDWQSTAGTVYGGTLDVKTGVLTVTHANIASYNGETINGPWISSMDVYSAGATPTTGAQVVYPLATPITYQLTPVEIRSLLGFNNVWADCGPVNVRYFVQSTQPMIDYIDGKVVEVFKATGHYGGTYTLDDVTCDELCDYARDHSNIVIKATRASSAIAYDIFILSDYIGTSATFRNAIITTAIGGGYVLEVRELQADNGNSTNALTVRYINIKADSNS